MPEFTDMFIGHFAVGLAAKKITPRTSLAVLFMACQFLDLVWPFAMLFGLEKVAVNRDLPTFNAMDLVDVAYSHSLGMALIWSFLFGSIVKYFSGSTRASIVTALVVFSHWILDYVTHIPDLPLWFDSQKVGLGLWKNAIATFSIETSFYALGIYLYLKTVAASQRRTLLFWSLILFLFIIYLVNVFGPIPPENAPIMETAFGLWLFVIWAKYIEKPSHI